MREKTFRVPSVREVLSMAGVRLGEKEKVNERFILNALNWGLFSMAETYTQGVIELEKIGENTFGKGKPLFIVFPDTFRVPLEDSNYGIKSLTGFVKLDSPRVLRQIARRQDVPEGFTRQFLEMNGKWPRSYIRRAIEPGLIEHPPMGFYWIGFDCHVRATTPLRCVTAAEMQVMKKAGDFPPAEIVDKKFYGRNLRARVSSRTEEGVRYDYNWARLPMHRRGDVRQYSDWVNMSCSSNDPDMVFRGEQHEKRGQVVNLFSAGAIYAFYEAMGFAKKIQDPRQFRINPFMIPVDKATIDHIDNLRLRALILDRNEETEGLNLRVLNKTEIDSHIMARTILRKYNNCWCHWGPRDLSYLYGQRAA